MAGLGGPPGLMTSGLLLGSGGGSGSGAVVGMLIPTAAVGSAGAPSGCTSPLAALRTDDGLSSPTAAGAGGSRTPGSNHAKGPRQLVYLGRLYGSEVVGRKCCVQLRGGARTFDKAVIVDFNDDSGQHRVRHAATRAEEWVSLGDIKFYWREAAPPEAPPNPSFKPECSSEACVGRRLRVYWPAMQKWYCGSVKAYDPLTGQHTVFYKDGDQQRLVLKHEPIVWADDEAAAEASGLITFISAASEAAAGGATTPRHPSSGTALGALGSSSGGGGGAGLFGGAPAGLLVPQGLFGGGSAMGLAPAGIGAGAAAAGVVGSLQQQQPQPAPQLPPQQQQQAAEPSTTYRAIVRRCFPPTPTRGNRGRAGGKPPWGRGGASVLGKHAREGAASADGAAAAPPKRKRGPKALRPAAMTAAAAAVVPNKHLAVNCRIGVYWRLDKAFYTGKIKGYSPQTGRFTLQYDDGQCEAVLLERERFVWHSPRGATAGFKPALHALMHALGAEGVKAVPQAQQQQQEAGATEGSRPPAPLTPAPEGAPHPPSSGPGAVGWRLALYWPADGAWHEAEVLSFNEPKRLHHVLYLDGEEEWLELGSESIVFLRAARSTAITAGHFLSTDDVSKKGGHDAVGWHVSVYWKDDKQFYQGQVADYNPASGKHKVIYVDGEVEELHLANERVIWRLPPNEASESGDDADGDAAAATKRNRGRGRDSDESDDMMETEEPVTEEPTATATDDDASTGGGGGGATGKKRPVGKAGATTMTKRRRRTRRGRGRPRTWHYDSDHSSDGRLLLHRHQQQPWGAHLVGSSAAQHGDAAAGGGSTAGQAHQFATPRAPGMAGTDAARVLMPRQSSTGGGGPSTAGTPAAAAGAGSMRPPAGAGGGPGTAGSGLLQMSSSGLPPAAQSGRAGASVLGSSVAPNGVLQLTLPAIQIRRATGSSCDGGGGSPLLLLPGGQRLEAMQLNVRIVAGGAAAGVDSAGAAAGPQQHRAVGSSSGSSGGAGAVAAAAADGGPTTAPAAGIAPAGGQAGSARASAAAATAAALAPLLPQMPAQHQRTALRLQRKMERLDMIMGKLTATASTYGWRLDPLDPLPPLQQQARTPGRGGAGRGGPGRSRSQPTSPSGMAGGGGSAGGRLGLSSPRAGSGPLSPRAAAYNAARAAAAGGSAGGALNGSNAGSLPTSPRGSMGAMSPTAGAAGAASGAGLAAGRPVAVHKTCAVKSRPGSSSGSGAQRLKARPYGGAAGGTGAAGAHSSSSTGGPGGAIAASTAGGSGELTSVLQATAAGNAIANQLQQHIQQQQQQLLQAGFMAAATGDAAAATALTAQAQLALAAAAAAKAEPANPAVPSSARASDEVVLRLQALAQGSGGLQLQQQLQYLQSAALATAAANAAAAAATAGTPAAGVGSKAADKAAEAAGKNK